jgi:hypothetical protein
MYNSVIQATNLSMLIKRQQFLEAIKEAGHTVHEFSDSDASIIVKDEESMRKLLELHYGNANRDN